MSPLQLKICTGSTDALALKWMPWVAMTMVEYDIGTPLRMAAFLATIGHESGGLRYSTELWGPTPAQLRYEGRADLGNIYPGDGSKYRGHGLIQDTGRANHIAVRDNLRRKFGNRVPDFEAYPVALALPEWAALSAGDFWQTHQLNDWADKPDFDGVCDIVNRGHKTAAVGDANGYANRLALYKAAMGVLT
jgi:putative chitinase